MKKRFNKNFLVIFIVVLITATISLLYHNNSLKYQTNIRPLLPELKSQINNLKKIQIIQESSITTLENDKNNWSIKEKFNLPANPNFITSLLLNLSQTKILEEKTSDESRYSKLGIDKKTSAHLIAYDKNNKPLVDIYIGKTIDVMEGTYVLPSGNPKIFLASGDLRVLANPSKWFDTNHLKISPNSIKQVKIAHKNKSYVILRDKQTDKIFTLQNIPQGYVLKAAYNLDNIITSLNDLGVDDVAKIDSLKNLKIESQLSVITFDGKNYELTIYEQDKKKWLKLEDSSNLKSSEFIYQISDTQYKLLAPTLNEIIEKL